MEHIPAIVDMNLTSKILICFTLVCNLNVRAQLIVTVSNPQFVAQKAVVPLTFKKNFGEKIESARAVVFLLDEQAKWLLKELDG